MKTINDFRPLLPAEQLLLDACKSGELAQISKKRPCVKTINNEVRAIFIRTLLLDKKIEIDPNGIQIEGAYITGELILENVKLTNTILAFEQSYFDSKISLMYAEVKQLNLIGSKVKFIYADGINCDDIFFREGFLSRGEVRLIGATIKGDLDCSGGKFFNNKGISLRCEMINIGGSIYMSDDFYARGAVVLSNSKVYGNVRLDHGKFHGINNQEHDYDIDFDGIEIGGSLYLVDATLNGSLNLTDSRLNSIVDDNNFWLQNTLKNIYFNGCEYRYIYDGELSAKNRLEWLAKMPEFKPQPYKQLARVFRDMGHIDDANEIMVAYHDKILEQKHEKLKKSFKNFSVQALKSFLYELINSTFSFLFKRIYKATSRYGYKPIRTFVILVGIWLSCSVLYWHAANTGVFAPSNPLVFQNKEYKSDVNSAVSVSDMFYIETRESKNWYYNTQLKGEYTTFQPFLYSLDVILPIVDLYMEKDWGVYIPTPSGYFDWLNPFTITFNHIIRLIVWLEILSGWALSLILVAILSGLAKNEKD